MSRIGMAPVSLPSGVTVNSSESTVAVKGPKGQLQIPVPEGISVSVDDGAANVKRTDDTKPQRALHGLTRALLNNAVVGVTDGYERVLEIRGTGYRAEAEGKGLKLSLGFSHPVDFPMPDGISCKVEERNTVIILNGIDKQQIGQVAANLRKLRPPDPYKGKGIRYRGERISLKPGKAAGK